jgi:hypothetical protein
MMYSKHLLNVSNQRLVKVKIIFIAECAGIVKYQVTQSTRLGPSNEVANVTILDRAHATGKEAHDSLTVSKTPNTIFLHHISLRMSCMHIMVPG